MIEIETEIEIEIEMRTHYTRQQFENDSLDLQDGWNTIVFVFSFLGFLQSSYPKGLRLIASYNSWWQKDLQFLIIAPSIVIGIVRYYLKDCMHFKMNWSWGGPLVSSQAQIAKSQFVLTFCFTASVRPSSCV